MVRAKYYSKRSSGSRYRRSNHAAPSSSHRHYGWSKMSTRTSSPSRGRERSRARYSSIDSLYNSRDSSYDRLTRPSKYNSDMSGRHRPPHYDRMVCEAVARLKSRKGSSIKDIAKNLQNKYPDTLKGKGKGTVEKIIATAKKLVKEGKLVRDGSHYRLSKTSSRSDDYYYEDDEDHSPHRQEKTQSGGKHSYSDHRSSKRGRPRKRSSRSPSESRSRSRSQSSPPRKARKRTTSHRKRKKGKTSTRGRGSWKRGTKRKKGGRKGQTRLATGKRGPYKKKVGRNRRRVKHSHTKRPKSEKLPDGDSSQNKGWFGGWFGARGGGDAKSAQKGSDKGSSSKSETKKSERSTGKESGGV